MSDLKVRPPVAGGPDTLLPGGALFDFEMSKRREMSKKLSKRTKLEGSDPRLPEGPCSILRGQNGREMSKKLSKQTKWEGREAA